MDGGASVEARVASDVVQCMALTFTKERLEKRRGETRVIAIARRDVKVIRLRDASAAEQPARELMWCIAAGAAGVFLLVRAYESGKTSEWVAGLVFTTIGALLLRNQVRRITVAEVETVNGRARISFEGRIGNDELAALKRRVRDELGWPVRD